MTSSRRPSLGFTLVELIVAGTIAAMVLGAVTFSLSQLGRARNIARDRAEAFQRAATGLESVRREVAAMIRSDDLFETRVLLTTDAAGMSRQHDRSELLLFSNSLRAMRPIEYQGEGSEYEAHFRVEDDELGAALWERRDNVPDEVPDGGGLAAPVADGVVGLLVEASDGEGGWRNEWDSDVDGLPKLVRISVTATGAELGTEITSMTPEVTLRTVVAVDRAPPPKPETPPEEVPQQGQGGMSADQAADASAAGAGGGGGLAAPVGPIDNGVGPGGGGRGQGRPGGAGGRPNGPPNAGGRGFGGGGRGGNGGGGGGGPRGGGGGGGPRGGGGGGGGGGRGG